MSRGRGRLQRNNRRRLGRRPTMPTTTTKWRRTHLTLFVGWGVGFNVGLLDGCCHKEMQILRITLSIQMGMRILLFHLHWVLGCLWGCGKGKSWDLA